MILEEFTDEWSRKVHHEDLHVNEKIMDIGLQKLLKKTTAMNLT